MIITEDKADQYVCPIMTKKTSHEVIRQYCLGSSCMAWVWRPGTTQEGFCGMLPYYAEESKRRVP